VLPRTYAWADRAIFNVCFEDKTEMRSDGRSDFLEDISNQSRNTVHLARSLQISSRPLLPLMRKANTALRKWFIFDASGSRDRLAFRPRTPGTGETTGGPFQGVRLHGIDVVALQAGHIGTTGSVGHRNQSSFANRASTQIHQRLQFAGDRTCPARSHNASGAVAGTYTFRQPQTYHMIRNSCREGERVVGGVIDTRSET
jgi:hypothetical protein